ncbi:midasin-like [Lingula anatina]|uniref:Midasin n=1 Tax=Lingula anatina TaxID=7574 RepID=A0A1S3IXZ2_LINAN|nr:midasin-like [Lingula anatina]|eukprot:XP_013402851.2 midasin-like [Lingula anatina]
MDVVSVLVPILESGTLALPSHGGVLKAAPGFQLSATQRLLSSATGLFRQQSSNSSMLERMWAKLNVEPLSRTELQQVIITTYPQLSTVVDRLLDIYFMLSAGKHELSSDSTAEEYGLDSIGKFLSHDGRLISTRDLIKWCHRISKDFDVTQSVTANVVLQEALDCFCACLSKPDKRLPLAEAIGARLNVTKAKAEYYCCKYKPDVEVSQCSLKSGRANIPIKMAETLALNRPSAVNFAFTRDAAILLERVAVCVANMEPVLLVGETGVGKTSAVQYLAQQTGHHLNVINMNQQSDSADLLGGFKPVDLRLVVAPFREDFEAVFCQSFSRKQNIKFLGHIQECFAKKRWSDLLKLISHTQQQGVKKYEEGVEMHAKWVDIGKRLQQLKIQISQTENSLAFTFLEGTLVKALKAGDWVLLDEINLATTETLECLSGLLESTAGSVVLMERGDTKPIVRHPEFRLFACMNPATDVGKKDLPLGIRNRFTEIFVDELESVPDLKILVNEYLKGLSLTAAQVEGIVKFYLTIRNEAAKKLTDGTGHRPHYSLRTLCRALKHAASNPCGTVPRSLYEGFCLSFLTQVDRSSHPVVEQLICQHILGKSNMKSILKKPLPEPQGGGSLLFEGFWVPTGGKEPHTPENYILTPGVRANLKDLARVVSGGRYPVLIQGETSVGKTSLINWLAQSSGNHCVRVNNHEHTDIQEYVGCYTADEMGKLVFKEGVLVDAMRKGHWIILDELNLAPSDVLEALNRLLDDNRELFIPETQETIKAHPRFMLFATQNPPGQYGGRKVLSRAFRNRFVELHFDEIPSGELQTILHQRCLIPLSYCKKLVVAMLDLQTRRRSTGVFAGKQGYITLRDLFRWAERYHHTNKSNTGKYYDWDQHLADHGYLLLAGRVRKPEEADVIQEVIQKHLKRSVDPDRLFTLDDSTSPTTRELLCQFTQQPPEGFRHIVWTYGMRRMAVLVGTALQFGEPVLLVGETGCGKTSMCQLYAEMAQQKMFAVNCHMHTESSDFLGGLRPVRHANSQEGSSDSKKLFDWVDGPLVTSMKEGAMFLADEISLADDSVLERLNSVLEPERTLLLAEKGTSTGPGMKEEADVIVAKEKFRLFATMNPGGDYGKKELSPALRNRFTEIWCPQTTERQDLVSIIEHNLKSGIHLCNQEDGTSGIGRAIMDFVEWFINNEAGKRSTVSIRDILSWVHFINTCARTVEADGMETDSNCKLLDPPVAYVHGACLVFLDALGFSNTNAASMASASASRTLCLQYLLQQVEQMTGQKIDPAKFGLVETYSKHVDVTKADLFGIEPFYIPKGPLRVSSLTDYAIHAPTTSTNAQRLLRALQLTRPVLLEGSPGVGKTSLVAALARASGNELVRINLSEQTDVTDLFGADLPVEGGEGGQFAWRDGPLLRALKAGHWVVLDELNLASQSVLEGLNACLDHRAEVYVPELGMTFHVQHNKTRLFACQNPLNQGGGRKGLPKSFLNRFTQVYVDPLGLKDLLFITKSMYGMFDEDLLVKMIKFNSQMYEQTMVQCEWGQRGGPWEFNLRDVFRWCDLMIANQSPGHWAPEEYVHLIYSSRMRTNQDKEKVQALFIGVFGEHCQPYTSSRFFCITPHVLQVGHSFLTRQQQVTNSAANDQTKSAPKILHHSLGPLEALMKCIEMNWMAVLVCGK